jgi:hypothetical protein
MFLGMRGFVIVINVVVALSMMGGQPHFTPRPSGPLPAVKCLDYKIDAIAAAGTPALAHHAMAGIDRHT